LRDLPKVVKTVLELPYYSTETVEVTSSLPQFLTSSHAAAHALVLAPAGGQQGEKRSCSVFGDHNPFLLCISLFWFLFPSAAKTDPVTQPRSEMALKFKRSFSPENAILSQ
jgi:hypothetical protein